MKKRHYTARQYKLAAGLVLAITAPAIAQVPPLNLPGLPPPPGATNPNTGSSNATGVPPLMIPVPGKSAVAEPKKEPDVTKSPSSSNPNPTDMLPAAMLKEAGINDDAEEDDANAPTSASDDAAPASGTIADAKDEDADKEQTADKADDVKPNAANDGVIKPADTATAPVPDLPPPPLPFNANPALPGLPPLAAIAPPGANLIGPSLPVEGEFADLENSEPKDLKSWETTLAPARTYPKTKFNYKRVVLPATVYRTQYNRFNRHLPKRLTREDLDKDFLIAVAKNDINNTRALINSGRNVNQMNAYGDSALIVAVRAGSYDTARLLLARGANPHFYGQGGKTAFHYARQQGNNNFAKMLLRQGV